jgi:hypothetical protein
VGASVEVHSMVAGTVAEETAENLGLSFIHKINLKYLMRFAPRNSEK